VSDTRHLFASPAPSECVMPDKLSSCLPRRRTMCQVSRHREVAQLAHHRIRVPHIMVVLICVLLSAACTHRRWNDARKLWGLTTNRCRWALTGSVWCLTAGWLMAGLCHAELCRTGLCCDVVYCDDQPL
jgi:hypothetical protein